MQPRILLCDDEIHIIRAAQFKLSRADYDVRFALDGEEAWEILNQWQPDLLVTDCQMPRLDGLGLVKRMREHPELHDVPVVMLTGKGFELSSNELAETLQILAVVPKPFSPRELLERVNALCRPEKMSV